MFTSLLCHRDVDIFKFNWFCSRMHLDKGFDIPHIILSDGSLSEEDRAKLESLPNIFVEEKPITLHKGSDGNLVPKAPLLGKLECLKRCFDNYDADIAVLFDCDIFFFKNWDSDLRKILTERAVVLRDWGSSIGPNREQYHNLFGVTEDLSTPNGNTGVISFSKNDWDLVQEKIDLHLGNTFMIMEDQGIMIAAFHGNLSYAEGIKCVINNAELQPNLWPYFLEQRAVHLMGMRTRPHGLNDCVTHSLASLPTEVSLKNFSPFQKNISFGLLEFDHYHFGGHLQKIPTTCHGIFVNNGMYMHGGSSVTWKFPDRCTRFRAKYECMDTGIRSNALPISVNGNIYHLGEEIDVHLDGLLEIVTADGPGSHLVFLNPRISIDTKTFPNLDLQKP